MSTAGRSPRGAAIVLAAALAIGAALRFWGLGHQSFWYDESITVVLLHHSFGRMLALLPKVEGTPPLYYCVAWLWSRAFGFSEAGIRSLSALAGLGLVAVSYGIGARLISRRAGCVAAALAACNPFLIWYSQEARAYSLLALMVSLSLLAFVELRSPRPPGRWVVAWTVAAALALATHYYAIVAVAPEAAWLVWRHRRDPRVWYAVTLVVAAGAALLPLALRQKGNTAWIAQEPFGARVAQIPAQFVRGTGAPAELWLELAAGLAVALALALLVTRGSARERAGGALAAGLGLGGLALSVALAGAGVDYVITRNLIGVLVALIVAAAAGLSVSRARWWGALGTAVLCLVGVVATIGVASEWRLQRPDWRGVAAAAGLTRLPRPPQAVIVEDDDSLEPLGVYAPVHVLPPWGAQLRYISLVAAVEVPRNPLCWWGAACHLPQAQLDTSFRLPGFVAAGPVLRVNQFAIYRLRASRARRVTPGQVGRALAGASLRSYALLYER